VERRFSKPSLGSNYKYCPIPLRFDPYTGCSFGCKYCFARDLVEHARKKTAHTGFGYIVGNRPDLFRAWVERVEKQEETDPSHGAEIAFRERVPMKIGTTADPFPYVEREERITYEILKILTERNYPVQISTKNPAIYAEYAKELRGANVSISVSLNTLDETFRKCIEPNAPAIVNRLEAIEKIANAGGKVVVRVQPVLYPHIMLFLPGICSLVASAGAYGIIVEGLKLRVAASKEEQAMIAAMNEAVGYDVRLFLKEHGSKQGNDMVYPLHVKEEYIRFAKEQCDANGIKLYVAENEPELYHYSASSECCGTDVLKGHKVLFNVRTCRDCKANFAEGLESAEVNFTRGYQLRKGKDEPATIAGDVIREMRENLKRRGFVYADIHI